MTAAEQTPWRRLAPKSILTGGTMIAAPLVPTVLIMALSGAGATAVLITGGIWAGIAILVFALTSLSWYFTFYRVTEHRFELREGNLSRSHRSIPRDRIRSVDITSAPMHRILGLSVVKIGTGQQADTDTDLNLDAIARPHAEQLRQELLHARPDPSISDTGEETTTADDGAELARVKPAWLGYGALTFSLIAIVWGALGSAFRSLQEVLKSSGLIDQALAGFNTVPLWISISISMLAFILTGVLGAVLLSTEMWWAFRLTREQDATLRVRRGLLTARSISLEERRLRGVEIAEPLLLRWAGGARTNAVATGLRKAKNDKQADSKALLPPAPRAEAQRVAAAVLREQRSPTDSAPLRAHPRAALRRRLTRGAAATALVTAAAATPVAISGASAWWAVWATAAIAAAAASGVAVDAYRNLGHALSDRYLLTRHGSAIRRTVALQRSGIIGWRIRQSPFQRLSGLLTVSATTAAGTGAYAIPDVDSSVGLAFADEALPDLLTPFLERR